MSARQQQGWREDAHSNQTTPRTMNPRKEIDDAIIKHRQLLQELLSTMSYCTESAEVLEEQKDQAKVSCKTSVQVLKRYLGD